MIAKNEDTSWEKEFSIKFGRLIIPGIKEFIQTLLDDQLRAYKNLLYEMQKKHTEKQTSFLRMMAIVCKNNGGRLVIPKEELVNMSDDIRISSYVDEKTQSLIWEIEEGKK